MEWKISAHHLTTRACSSVAVAARSLWWYHAAYDDTMVSRISSSSPLVQPIVWKVANVPNKAVKAMLRLLPANQSHNIVLKKNPCRSSPPVYPTHVCSSPPSTKLLITVSDVSHTITELIDSGSVGKFISSTLCCQLKLLQTANERHYQSINNHKAPLIVPRSDSGTDLSFWAWVCITKKRSLYWFWRISLQILS